MQRQLYGVLFTKALWFVQIWTILMNARVRVAQEYYPYNNNRTVIKNTPLDGYGWLAVYWTGYPNHTNTNGPPHPTHIPNRFSVHLRASYSL